MGRITLELSDETLHKASLLAAKKGVPLTMFLAHQVNELVAANDRYERAKASVAHLYPDTQDDVTTTQTDSESFFDRWRHRPTTS
jgi:hypothetical protein